MMNPRLKMSQEGAARLRHFQPRWRYKLWRLQILTSLRRSTLIFLRYLFAYGLSFTFCDFDRVAFLIISTAVTHHRLARWSVRLNCSDALVTWPCDVAMLQFDNDERHVTAFRPVSEAARIWSCDNTQMIHGSECDIQIWWTRGRKCRTRP